MRRRLRRRDEAGVSSVELVLYMPILMAIIFIAVQFMLVYFGNQAASAVARETARIARVEHNNGAAEQHGRQYAANISNGSLQDITVTVVNVGPDRIRVTVTGRAQEISPVGVPLVRHTVEGPIEEFEAE